MIGLLHKLCCIKFRLPIPVTSTFPSDNFYFINVSSLPNVLNIPGLSFYNHVSDIIYIDESIISFFSNLLLLFHSYGHIVSSAPYSQTPSIPFVLPLWLWCHTYEQVKIQLTLFSMLSTVRKLNDSLLTKIQ